MDTELLELFSTKHIPQIRDELKYINLELNKIDVNLNNNLNLHYKDILNITNNVTDMFNSLQSIDSDFRDLCFDDNLYQLHSLPEFSLNSNNNKSNISNNSTSNSLNKKGNKIVINNDLLLISQLSLQLQKLINFNFDIDDNIVSDNNNVNNSFLAVWDELLIKINELPSDCLNNVNDSFHKIIKDNCKILQKFIQENNDNLPFSELQWIQFYNISFIESKIDNIEEENVEIGNHNAKAVNLPWDLELNEQLIELVFNNLYNILNFDKNNSIILNFMQLNQEFSTFIFDKINSNFNNFMTELSNELKKDDITNDSNDIQAMDYTLKPIDLTTDKLDVEDLIKSASLQSNGLINDSRIITNKLIIKLIDYLQEWISFNGDSLVFQELKDKLIEQLNNLHFKIRELPTSINLIESFNYNYYNDIFINLINDHLEKVKDLQIK